MTLPSYQAEWEHNVVEPPIDEERLEPEELEKEVEVLGVLKVHHLKRPNVVKFPSSRRGLLFIWSGLRVGTYLLGQYESDSK